jgi:hypothetical protein
MGEGGRLPENNVCYRRIDEIISRKVDTGTVMLKLDTASYYGLDESGTLLWNALARPCGASELAALLQSEFQIAEERAFCDVKSFVQELLADGLIETTADAAVAPLIGVASSGDRTYAPPVLERGLLRQAANNTFGSLPDGGFFHTTLLS